MTHHPSRTAPASRVLSLAARFACVAALATASCTTWPGLSELGSPPVRRAELPPDDALPYDRWRQKSVHNAYDRRESIHAQLTEHGFRSLELDIHESRLGIGAKERDWWVYHYDLPGFDDSSCDTLGECFAEIDAFRSEAPLHDVLTVFVDLKEAFERPTHGPRELDARIRSSLPAGSLYEPADALARCPEASHLRAAVSGSCGWPTLGELRGRVIVVLTGGDLCRPDSPLRAYLDGTSSARAAFVATELSEDCDLDTQARVPEAVFFNLRGDALHQAEQIARLGLVSRGFSGGLQGGINDRDEWREALEAGVQILATDRVDAERDPWTNVLTVPRPAPRNVASREEAKATR